MTTSTANAQATPESITLALVTTLEATWTAIRARHPEVPEVVLTLGSGTLGERAGHVRLGHFAAARWHYGDTGELAEMFVAGEGLNRGALDVLATLLHEAAHGLAFARGIKDTSRQGRFHNGRFRAVAEELGLTVAQAQGLGWNDTTVPDATAAAYSPQLDQLAAALTAYRRSEHTPGTGGRTNNNNGHAARCACGRRIRVAPSVLEVGPIICGLCDATFEPVEAAGE